MKVGKEAEDTNGRPLIIVNGFWSKVLSSLIVAATLAGGSGLIWAAKLAWGQEEHLKEHAIVAAKVEKLWENDIRNERRSEEMAHLQDQQDQLEEKLDALLMRQGINPKDIEQGKSH